MDFRLRGNDGGGCWNDGDGTWGKMVWAGVLDLMMLIMEMVMCGKLCADSSILGFNRTSNMYSFRGDN